MNIKLLKSLRVIACIPFLLLFVVGIHSLLYGTAGFFGSEIYGIEAALFDIVLLVGFFWWIFAISLVTIIVTTILIKKHS